MRKFLQDTLGKIFTKVDWLNTPVSVYVRYILAIVAAVNTILNIFDISPIVIDKTELYDVLSAIFFLVILFTNTYKDNPTSSEAIESNKYMKMLKANAEARRRGEIVDAPIIMKASEIRSLKAASRMSESTPNNDSTK